MSERLDKMGAGILAAKCLRALEQMTSDEFARDADRQVRTSRGSSSA